MFKIVKNRTFTHDVVVMMPVNGGFEKEKLVATFNYLSLEDQKTFDLGTYEGTSAFLKRVIVCLDELADADGNSIPYSDGVRDQIIGMNNARIALTGAYFEAVTEAKQGN